MAVIRKSLGNNQEVIENAFRREGYTDGLGGYAFKVFCDGWRAAWKQAQIDLPGYKALAQRIEKLEALLTKASGNLDSVNNALLLEEIEKVLEGEKPCTQQE